VSNISKRHIPTEELLGEYLTFVPPQRVVDAFRVDMKTLHPTLLRDAIREAVKTRQVQPIPADQQRALIHRIYTRKIKEFSSLYPFIFAIENGLRSQMAENLMSVFGQMDWWVILRDEWLRDRRNPTVFPDINGIAVKAKFVRSAYYILGQLSADAWTRISGPNLDDEFFFELSFGQLARLIEADWPLSRGMFLSDATLGAALPAKTVHDAMDIVKVARNEIFHSKPIKNRSAVVGACDRILNLLAFHLDEYDQALAGTTITRVRGTIARAPFHVIPPR